MKRFVPVFLLILAALFGIKLLPAVQQAVVLPWTATIGRASAFFVLLLDPGAIAHGREIYSPQAQFGLSVDPLCSGLEACIVLFSGILAYPALWRERFLGLVLGFAALQTVNLVRIITLFFIGKAGGSRAFDIAHTYVWQALLMLCVLAFWLLWVRYANRCQQRRDEAREAARAFHWPMEDVK